MGGFITSRAFLMDDRFDGLINLNSSSSWVQCERSFQNAGFKPSALFQEIERHDPVAYLDMLEERPVLLLHGENDQAIPTRTQLDFYEKARTFYADTNRITLELFPNINHTTSLSMVERIVDWLESTFIPQSQ
ncbi:alpha/beta hydrolase [Alkalihalobacillus sp. AL-G]|nr:alpha/beta hydrolase [Alkalihalobacillus sp. AL-G]